jgi:nicotinamidase-related amidase
MTATSTTLLLLDLQQDFLADDGRMPVCHSQVPALIEAVNALLTQPDPGYRIVYVGNEFSNWDYPANWFRHQAAVKGSPGCLLDDRIGVVTGRYFPKHKASAFTNTELVRYLDATETRTVVLCGVFAAHCVQATCRAALRAGFRTSVLSDAVADRSDAGRDAALERMRRAGASILTSQQFLQRTSAP